MKDRSIALILEIVLGLFGIYGIGWIYSNKANVGVPLLIGGIVWAFMVITADIITGGIGLFCTIPINLGIIAVSAIQLNSYTKQHPEMFA